MKKFYSICVLVVIFFSACYPQVTTPPEVTVTLPPPSTQPLPTETPIPAPTIHPQFIVLQDRITSSGETYTLNQNGEIEMQTEDGMSIIPDIQVQPDGTMTFTHDGQEFTANTETLVIDGRKFTFKDTEGKTWVFGGISLSEEIREFAPAEGIVYEESLSDITTNIDPRADPKSIYWDIVMSKILDTKSIEENRAIYDEIIADAELMEKHPEWKDLSHNLPKESKKAYMTEYLKRSGGIMVIKGSNWSYHPVDFNRPLAKVMVRV
jgi:hypothetical protein